jgi:hypothetical protein
MASKYEILKAVELLASIFGTEPETLEGFYRALKDIDQEAIDEAIDAWVKQSPWFPKPADLYQIAKTIMNQKEEQKRPEIIGWRAASLLALWTTGKMTDDEFFSDKLTKMMTREGRWNFDPETPEEATTWDRSRAEVEQWMIEDYGEEWRTLTPEKWQAIETASMERSQAEWSEKMKPIKAELQTKFSREPGPFEVDQLFLERYYAEVTQ